VTTQASAVSYRTAVPYSSEVCDRIIHGSHPANAAVPAEDSANGRWAHAERLLDQTSRCIPASVRDADAAIDQTTVTQLTTRPGTGGPPTRRARA